MFDGDPADYGPLFVHGDDPGFLAAVDAVPGKRRPGWPARVSGRGAPCQPDAFAPFETRLAFEEGVNAFPRALAQGLPIRLRAQAASVGIGKEGVSLTLADGDHVHARDLVLAMALEQVVPFVRMLGEAAGRESPSGSSGSSSVAGALGVLEMFSSIPCLTGTSAIPRTSRLSFSLATNLRNAPWAGPRSWYSRHRRDGR
jgi:hypothetical protein